MRELLKKEWRQMRLIPLAYAMLVSLLLILSYIFDEWQHRQHLGLRLKLVDTFPLLAVGCSLAGWLAGSNAIAPEVGHNTLQFLTILPTGRLRIWIAKFGMGAMVSLASFAAVVVAYFATAYVLFGHKQVTDFLTIPGHGAYNVVVVKYIICVAAFGYSLSLLISTFVDRALLAAVLSLGIGIAAILLLVIGAFIGLILLTHWRPLGYPNATATTLYMDGLEILPGLACVMASVVAFCRRKTLRTNRRFVQRGSA